MRIFQLLESLPSPPLCHIRLNSGQTTLSRLNAKDLNECNEVRNVREATILDRSDEHFGKGWWGVCNPRRGDRMACTGGMSWVRFLQYNPEVDWPDTRPHEWADVIYPWCCPIHFCIPHAHISTSSSNLSISSSIHIRTLPRWWKVPPKVSQHSYHQWQQAFSMTNDHLYCRAQQTTCGVHCQVARWKDFYISVPLQQCATVYVCDSETGHCISGPFELKIYVIGGLDLMPWWGAYPGQMSSLRRIISLCSSLVHWRWRGVSNWGLWFCVHSLRSE